MTQEFDAEMMKGFKDLGASILARLEEAEKDKARLDWIEARSGANIVEFAMGGWEVGLPDDFYASGDSMREAIDAAMKESGA